MPSDSRKPSPFDTDPLIPYAFLKRVFHLFIVRTVSNSFRNLERYRRLATGIQE